MTTHIRTSITGHIMTVTMCRPEKKNALTHAMYAAMADALVAAEADAAVRVVCIAADGDAFTAGNDLADFRDTPPDGRETPVARFLHALITAEKPIVAVVNGVAVGIGLTMLLHCDLVFAGESASFQAPFANLALVPEAASSLLLPQRVGRAVANDLFMLGRRLDAVEALQVGLVSRVFADAELAARARALVGELARKAPTAIKLTKRLQRGDREALLSQLKIEGEYFARQLRSPELKEAIAAFMERREPVFG